MEALVQAFARSRADDAFKEDVRAYASYRPAARVTLERNAPRVKVLRVITQLLTAEPDVAVARVRLRALSGCCDFRGTVVAETTDGDALAFDFVWDCRWRAEAEGWVDRYGTADQRRAAREFGWRCFAVWQPHDRADGRHA